MNLEHIIGPYWHERNHVVTRQFSAENPGGFHGGGARSVPDPSDPNLRHSEPAVVLGRGFKVRPYVSLGSAETCTLAEADGPGIVTHLFVTSDLADYGNLRLRCFWDGSQTPAVDVPLGAFFGIGHRDRPHEVTSLISQVGPSRGCSAYWPMPFAQHALLTLENVGKDAALVVAYRVVVETGGKDVSLARFHAHWAKTLTSPDQHSHQILPFVQGRGAYVGTTLFWTAREVGWWGEGQVKFYLDGDSEFPTLVDNGTEDYFGGAWGFGRDDVFAGPTGHVERPFNGPYSGAPLVESDESAPRHATLYRWHLPDPIWFLHDIRVEVQALGWGPDKHYRIRRDDVASVGYWYSWGEK